jgi:glycosyltransferase involved in cell wall biosynthesis
VRSTSRTGAHTAVLDVAYFATQGSGSRDEQRIRDLLQMLDARPVPFDRGARVRSCLAVIRAVRKRCPDLVVMEGMGVAGGAAVLISRWLLRVPFAVSSGDAIAPFVRTRRPILAPIAGLYERVLCRQCAGFIGWSPYLTGRALTFGAPRAMTAPNWAPPRESGADGTEVRERLGIPADMVVFGIVGSLDWNSRVRYCYGLELLLALARVSREDIGVLIVGSGSGRERLEALTTELALSNVYLTGSVARSDVSAHLDAIDVASLPQSVDGVGAFRFTTKLSEYLSAELPVVTGQLPAAYDLDDGWLWRLPGDAPWHETYIAALAQLMNGLSRSEIESRRSRVPRSSDLFDFGRQRQQVASFIEDLIRREHRSSPEQHAQA